MHKNNSIIGSSVSYSGEKTIDLTDYDKMVIKYRSNLQVLMSGLSGFHANSFIGLQKELGTYENFIKEIHSGCDVNKTENNTGIITEELDISSITGEAYFAIHLGDCGGISELYLYDIYLTQNEIKEYLNETSDTALEIKITTEEKNM